MTDVVFKVSQSGYDVNTAADSELLFNSSWPLLKIAFEGDYTITTDDTQTIFAHNLGYQPAFFVMDYTSQGNGQSTSNAALNNTIGINPTQLIYFGGSFLPLPITIHYYIYLLDLTKSFTGPIVRQSYQTPGQRSDDVAIKVAKPGKSVRSTDYRDYTLHSGTQTPMVHMVANQSAPSPTNGNLAITAQHNLGYLPLFFPFATGVAPRFPTDHYFFTGNYTQALPRVFGNTSYTEIQLANNQTGTLVIFKDPYSIDIPNLVVGA